MDFLVIELVQGKTLKELIGGEGLPYREVAGYGVQIASALAAAHSAGIVHWDIKPANIMVTPDNRIKLLDFGIAKLSPAAESNGDTRTQMQQTSPGMAIGTVA